MDSDILSRLGVDPGRRTLGELLQDREAAAIEIAQLRAQLQTKRIASSAMGEKATRIGTHGAVFLRLRDVCQIVGLSRSTIYKRLAEGQFPTPVRLGDRTVRWSAESVSIWCRTHVAAR